MYRTIYLCLTLFLCLPLVSAPLADQSGAEHCVVRVIEPKAGQSVALVGTVKVFAEFPSGLHLWIFVRPAKFKTFDWWYPQGEAWESAADPATGNWESDATFGTRQQDIQHPFHVTAAVLAQGEHDELKESLKQAMKANKYEPIEMPTTVCTASIVTVTKVRD